MCGVVPGSVCGVCGGKSLIALYFKAKVRGGDTISCLENSTPSFELCNLSDIYHISFISFTCCSQEMMKFIMIISFDL